MFLKYAKTKALELVHNDQGSATTEYAVVLIAMVSVLLPSMYYYTKKVQQMFMVIADLWSR
jgi:Flp pilus assembly pilin Flp